MNLTLILKCNSGSVQRVPITCKKINPDDLDLDENQPAFVGYIIKQEEGWLE